jgi:hypothetical protein
MNTNVVLDRLGRLARLDTTVFDEVRDDQQETLPAAIIAVVSALLAGIGAWLFWEIAADTFANDTFVNGVIFGTIFLIVAYVVGVLVCYVVLAQVYNLQVDLMSLVRTMGYAALPMALSFLMLIPFLYPVFAVVPVALLLVMMIHAVAATSGATSMESTVAATAGFVVMVLVAGFLAQQHSVGDAPLGAGIFGLFLDWSP